MIVCPFVGTEPVRVLTCRALMGARPTFPRLNYVLWIQDIVKTFVLGDEVVRGIDVCALSNSVKFDLLIHEAVELEPPPYILYCHVAWNQSGPLLLLVSAPQPFLPS